MTEENNAITMDKPKVTEMSTTTETVTAEDTVVQLDADRVNPKPEIPRPESGLPHLDSETMDDFDRDNQEALADMGLVSVEDTEDDNDLQRASRGQRTRRYLTIVCCVLGAGVLYPFVTDEGLRASAFAVVSAPFTQAQATDNAPLVSAELAMVLPEKSKELATMERLESSLDILLAHWDGHKSVLASIEQHVADNHAAVLATTERLAQLEAQVIAAAEKQAAKPAPVSEPRRPAWLDQAAIVSIRKIGNHFVSHVVLPNGSVRLRVGDRYRDWTVTAIDSTAVIFSRADKHHTVRL